MGLSLQLSRPLPGTRSSSSSWALRSAVSTRRPFMIACSPLATSWTCMASVQLGMEQCTVALLKRKLAGLFCGRVEHFPPVAIECVPEFRLDPSRKGFIDERLPHNAQKRSRSEIQLGDHTLLIERVKLFHFVDTSGKFGESYFVRPQIRSGLSSIFSSIIVSVLSAVPSTPRVSSCCSSHA